MWEREHPQPYDHTAYLRERRDPTGQKTNRSCVCLRYAGRLRTVSKALTALSEPCAQLVVRDPPNMIRRGRLAL